MEDVLLDAELISEEIRIILSELGLPEIAVLLKKHPLMPDIDMVDLRESEQILTKCVHDFVSTLPQEQQKLIEHASKAIRPIHQDCAHHFRKQLF